MNSFNFIIIEVQVLLTVVSNLAAREDLCRMLGGSCSQVEPCSLQGGHKALGRTTPLCAGSAHSRLLPIPLSLTQSIYEGLLS